MNAIFLSLPLALLGVDYGWQTAADGDLEYVIQIEPQLWEALKSGTEITSEIHPDVRGVRRFRIRVGTDKLPRQALPQREADLPKAAKAPPWRQPQPEEQPSSSPTALELPDPVPADKLQAQPPEPKIIEPPSPRWTTPWPESEPTAEPERNDSPITDEPASEPPPMPAHEEELLDQLSPSRFNANTVNNPRQFDPDPKSFPLDGQRASYTHPEEEKTIGNNPANSTSPAPKHSDISQSNDKSVQPVSNPNPKPWLLLSMVMLGLFASLGGNVYLGWIAWDTHGRYQAMVTERKIAGLVEK